jgi:hypothetical protein
VFLVFNQFVRFLLGFMENSGDGSYCGAVFKHLAKRGLVFLDIENLSFDKVSMSFPRRDFERPEKRRKSGVRRIQGRKNVGHSPLFLPVPEMKSLLLGGLFFFAGIYATQLFFMGNRNRGGHALIAGEILSMMEEKGVKKGAVLSAWIWIQ